MKLISCSGFPIVAFQRNLCTLKTSSKISVRAGFNGKVKSELVLSLEIVINIDFALQYDWYVDKVCNYIEKNKIDHDFNDPINYRVLPSLLPS